MKKILAIFISLLCMTTLFAQEYSEEELRTKLHRSLKIKHTGQGLVIAGVVIDIVGYGLMRKGADDGPSVGSKSGEEAFALFFGGMLVVVVGQVAIGIGIPFWIVGGRRSNQYNRLLKNYDNELSLKITNRGLGLHYSF